MDPTKSLKSQILDKNRLGSLMLKDVSVVPPESVIKTVPRLAPNDVELIFTRDAEDLSTGSFIVRQGEFAGFFLDAWFDPVYRNYNFVRAETHALVSGLFFFNSVAYVTAQHRMAYAFLGSYHSMASDNSRPVSSGFSTSHEFLQQRFYECCSGWVIQRWGLCRPVFGM